MASTSFTAESGRNQFLQLFATQLQNQDPLEPTKQEDFLLQLAQFSMVEGVEKMNSKLDKLIGLQQQSEGETPAGLANGDSQWLGKQITYLNASQKTQTGVVTGVEQKSGQLMIRVGADLISATSVIGISHVETAGRTAYDELATATALLGKTVGTADGYSGVVKGIQQVNGMPQLFTGDRLLSLADIRSVLN